MSESIGVLPAGWEQAILGDLVGIRNGFAFKSADFIESGIPLIRQSNLDRGIVKIQGAKFLPEAYIHEYSEYIVSRGDILLGMSGSIGEPCEYQENFDALQNQRVGLIVFPKATNIPRKFALYFLEYSHKLLMEKAKGIAVQNVSAKNIEELSILVPPVEEQFRIVDTLEELFSDLDDGVTELKAAQIKLSQYRQSLLKSAVEGSLTAEWREQNKVQETGEQLLQRILKERREHWEKEKLSEFEAKGKKTPKDWQKKYPEPVQPNTFDLPDLPEGWTWASLDMIGEIVSGVTKGTKRKTPVSTREVPYLRVANVQRGYLDLIEIKTIEATEADIVKYTLQKNDILFNEGGDRDKLGRGWVWRSEIDGCIHQNHVFRLRLFISEVVPELISHYANTFGKLWFQHAGKQTTNLASINKGILKSFPIPLAPLEEQRVINEELEEKISQLEAQVEETSSALTLCEAQRKKILQDAFSGKLVAQNPNDGPAIELLEKIKTERAKRSTQLQPKRFKRKPSEEALVMENLEEVLKNKADWVDAQEAFRECGVKDGTDTDRIEELYAELRKLDKEGRLAIERHGDYDKLRLKAE